MPDISQLEKTEHLDFAKMSEESTVDYNGLNKEQYEATMHINGPELILAGAGSGKTRVITHRIAHLIKDKNVNASNILAITFTNKAADEMKQRASILAGQDIRGARISTFHSLGVFILRKHADKLGYRNSFSISDDYDKKKRIKEVCEYLGVENVRFGELIGDAKIHLMTPDDIPNTKENFEFINVYREYQQRLTRDNVFDFEDLIMHSVELFQQFPKVLNAYQEQFRYIMVDEYQDTDPAQFELIRLLASKYRNLCVVGDDDQSIYSFRGADVTNILNFENEYEDAYVVKLEQNYRSTGMILNAANDVIHHNIERKEKSLRTEKADGIKPLYLQVPSQNEESEYIVSDIKQKMNDKGYDYSDFAVLYRTHAQSRKLEEAFMSHYIPYRIIGGINFYGRQEIKDIVSYLKVIDDPSDSIAVKRIINIPKRGIGKTTIQKVENYAIKNGISFFEALSKCPDLNRASQKITEFLNQIQEIKDYYDVGGLDRLLPYLIDKIEYREYLTKIGDPQETIDTRNENIDELVSKLSEFPQTLEDPSEATISKFLEDIALISDKKDDDSDNKVLMMTLHSSKGLEFKNVYIPGMDEGIFPFSKAEDLEEERRLAYVGITRAEESLTLIHSEIRMMYGRTDYYSPSRFIDEIDPSHVDKKNL